MVTTSTPSYTTTWDDPRVTPDQLIGSYDRRLRAFFRQPQEIDDRLPPAIPSGPHRNSPCGIFSASLHVRKEFCAYGACKAPSSAFFATLFDPELL
ncbi:hypothetical protein, partial [Sphingobium sp. Ant17]|uniref:hypothetical protein n=1 Tax=Sphingobium sp. Ant17 TaxID=1461752 RepID=UPI001F3920F0